MICQNCGSNVDGKRFCPQCGAPVAQPMGYQGYAQPVVPQGNPTQVLVFGIIGLALSEFGIIGLIFSIIGRSKGSQYIATYGDISTQVRVGRRLALAGLIVSIVMTVFWTLYFLLIAFMLVHYSTNAG